MNVLSTMNTMFRSSTIRNAPGAGRSTRSPIAAASVSAAARTFSRAVVRSSGRMASSTALTAGMPSIAPTRTAPGSVIGLPSREALGVGAWDGPAGSRPLPPGLIERVHVHRVEPLPDAEEKDADHDQRDEDRE